MARRMAVHFWPALALISRSTSLTKRSNSGSPAADQIRIHTQLRGGVGRAGEGDDVGLLQPVQQVARAADDQLQRAGRQQTGLLDQAHAGLGDVAGRGGRLDDAGHARDEAGREFLQHPPHREVEGVDVHRDAALGHQHVGAHELAALAQRLGGALVDEVAGRELTAAHGRIGEERADAALDVDPGIGSRRAGVGRDRVELFLALGQVSGQRLEEGGALLEIQRQQRRQRLMTCEMQALAEVDLLGMGLRHQPAVDGAVQAARGGRADPATGDQALKNGVALMNSFLQGPRSAEQRQAQGGFRVRAASRAGRGWA
ncbi:hypothetical protein Ddc_20862 [Ditylenchus destructor]|nr:hypothetical protein Ddc_20862 [Ditylenchus destructor]